MENKIRVGLIGPHGRLGQAIARNYPVFPIDRKVKREALPCDVLIDVSSPLALEENLSARLPIVIGTTGHADFSLIEEAAKSLPVFYAPNFSLGMALFQKAAKEFAARFPSDRNLLDIHHKHKKDTPSGTALLLAKEIPHLKIHSIRTGEVIGEHTLLLESDVERISLSHSIHSRDAFAQGALLAAQFLIEKPAGLYTMDNLIDDPL